MSQPVSTNQPFTINIDPAAKIVVCSAVTQAAGTQHVQVKNSAGTVVFSASGSGTGAKQIGFGTFVPSGTGVYTVSLTANGNAINGETALVFNGTVFLDQYTFIVNDSGGDKDFNDLYVTI